MTRDDIIRIAREAGFEGLLPSEHVNGLGAIYSGDEEITEIVERFYALVAAHEREACARVCEETEVVREKWCVELYDNGSETLMEAAKAIRARGEPPIG